MKRKPRVDIRQYINSQILDQICDEVQQPRITMAPTAPPASDSEDENGVDYSHAMKRRMSTGNGYHSDEDGF